MDEYGINKDKINYFINVYLETLGIQINTKEGTYIANILKDNIYKRCLKYKDISPVTIDLDKCENYILKPDLNGVYSWEDFFLNRLFQGLRSIDISSSLEGNSGEYTAYNKSLNVNPDAILNAIASSSISNRPDINVLKKQIPRKTFTHEIGHCLKTQFKGGYKAPLGQGREQDKIYERLINNLKNYENGKYSSQIKTIAEMSKSDEPSEELITGVRYRKNKFKNKDTYMATNYTYDLGYLDELFNEQEALELTNSNVIQKRYNLLTNDGKVSDNYVNCFNYISGYRSFTGYGEILHDLLGTKNTFHAEYIDPNPIFYKFDQEYSNISQEIFKSDRKPLEIFAIIINSIKKNKSEEDYLLLDEFFARCFEQKFNKYLEKKGTLSKEDIDKILSQIERIELRLTTNDNLEIRDKFKHVIIFKRIKEKILSLSYTELLTELDSEELSIETKDNNVIYQEYIDDMNKIADAISLENHNISHLWMSLDNLEKKFIKVNLNKNSYSSSSLDERTQFYLYHMKKSLKDNDIDAYRYYRANYEKALVSEIKKVS